MISRAKPQRQAVHDYHRQHKQQRTGDRPRIAMADGAGADAEIFAADMTGKADGDEQQQGGQRKPGHQLAALMIVTDPRGPRANEAGRGAQGKSRQEYGVIYCSERSVRLKIEQWQDDSGQQRREQP